MLWQPSLPDQYLDLSAGALAERITARRCELGDDLLILGHHYQQDDVIRHADLTGDSLKLSQLAAEEAPRRGTKFIIFCGVHFMAETADILTDESVKVILPDLSAGCSMADMADYDDLVDAWAMIHETLNLPLPPGEGWGEGTRANGLHTTSTGDRIDSPLTPDPSPKRKRGKSGRVIPITYVNSTAAVKAFVGEHGGACCTSSNAMEIFTWAMNGGTALGSARDDEEIKLLFLPDQHLGRNTASKFGLITEVDARAKRKRAQTAVWNPRKQSGGLMPNEILQATVLLWAGHCSVHKLFRPEHVDEVRAEFTDKGGITVIVHPECCKEVVDKSDLTGSTESIIRTIESAAPGSNWAVGTEIHLVNRLASAAAKRGVNVRILSDCQCLCTTMYRIDQPHLLWALDNLAARKVVNQVTVTPKVRELARLALDRMLANVGRAARTPAMVD